MYKYLIPVLIFVLSFNCAAETKIFEGLWEAGDTAHKAIYGYIKITGESVSWGHDVKNFPCKASYKIFSEQKAKNYPGNHVSVPDYVSFYNIVKLLLKDKDCQYDLIANSHVHKKLGYIQFSIPEEVDGEEAWMNFDGVGFNDFDESNESMGWGMFSKIKTKKGI